MIESPERIIEGEIGEYLDQFYAQLLGIIPYRERKAVRDDIEEHLNDLVRDYRQSGATVEQALTRALSEFGSATHLAEEYLRNRELPYAMSRREGRLRSGTTQAYLLFILPAVAFVLANQLMLFYGDSLHLFPWIIALACVTPIIAGLYAGWSIRDRFIKSVLRALLIVLGFAVLAMVTTSWFAFSFVVPLVILLAWFPGGLVGAFGGAYLRQRRRTVQDA
jgi:VIT1/CCC1 family predicted Fe2+/Mn2+ transporter